MKTHLVNEETRRSACGRALPEWQFGPLPSPDPTRELCQSCRKIGQKMGQLLTPIGSISLRLVEPGEGEDG